MRADRDRIVEHDIDAAGDHVVQRGRAASVGHMLHLDAGNRLEQFGDQMRRSADAGRGERYLARILLRVGDELRHRIIGCFVIGDEQVRAFSDQMHRQETRQRIVGQVFAQRDVGRHRALRAVDHRVAIRFRSRHLFGADRAATAAAIIDQDRLTEHPGHFLSDDARCRVRDAARREGYDPGDRTAGKVFGRSLCDGHDGRKQDRKQDVTLRHGIPPRKILSFSEDLLGENGCFRSR